jgi:hypothetical protein
VSVVDWRGIGVLRDWANVRVADIMLNHRAHSIDMMPKPLDRVTRVHRLICRMNSISRLLYQRRSY